jgi:hypothetical protein
VGSSTPRAVERPREQRLRERERAQALAALDAKALEQGAVDETLGVLLKYQDDIAKLKGEEAARLIAEARAG